MIGLRINDGRGRYGSANEWYYATFDSANKTVTYLSNDTSGGKPGDANQVAVNLGASFANVTYAAWEGYLLQADTFIDATVDPPVRLAGPKGTR